MSVSNARERDSCEIGKPSLHNKLTCFRQYPNMGIFAADTTKEALCSTPSSAAQRPATPRSSRSAPARCSARRTSARSPRPTSCCSAPGPTRAAMDPALAEALPQLAGKCVFLFGNLRLWRQPGVLRPRARPVSSPRCPRIPRSSVASCARGRCPPAVRERYVKMAERGPGALLAHDRELRPSARPSRRCRPRRIRDRAPRRALGPTRSPGVRRARATRPRGPRARPDTRQAPAARAMSTA